MILASPFSLGVEEGGERGYIAYIAPSYLPDIDDVFLCHHSKESQEVFSSWTGKDLVLHILVSQCL